MNFMKIFVIPGQKLKLKEDNKPKNNLFEVIERGFVVTRDGKEEKVLKGEKIQLLREFFLPYRGYPLLCRHDRKGVPNYSSWELDMSLDTSQLST